MPRVKPFVSLSCGDFVKKRPTKQLGILLIVLLLHKGLPTRQVRVQGMLGTRGKPLVAFTKPNLPRPRNQADYLFIVENISHWLVAWGILADRFILALLEQINSCLEYVSSKRSLSKLSFKSKMPFLSLLVELGGIFCLNLNYMQLMYCQ